LPNLPQELELRAHKCGGRL